MKTESVDVYVAGFVARCKVMRGPDQLEVDEPGMHGLLPSAEDPRTRLLITDDRAYDRLAAVLPAACAGIINVLAAAERCAGLVVRNPGWAPDEATAMICRDLQAVPAPPLPCKLTLEPVRRRADDPPGGVPLTDAVATAARASPAIDAHMLTDYLRSLPPAVRLFAAVDSDGVVRATSAAGAFGTEATVMFVNTDPDWRGRGIGRAMTATALRAARTCGARHASLDASHAGARIYRRLGFETVTRTTRFFHRA